MADRAFYTEQLYPLQDRVLGLIHSAGTGFYLTGGTAVSRIYLSHRYSDDLDLFVNWDKRFASWSAHIVTELIKVASWQVDVVIQQEYFTRLIINTDIALKVELVNDVAAHAGEITVHPILGRIDSAENILANKLTALVGRDEARDLADVWGLCTKLGLSIQQAITNAKSKSNGLYPPDIAKRLCSATERDWSQVRWIHAPNKEEYIAALFKLGEDLILGR